MLVIICRSIIIYVFLLLGMRLMGKRTIGELQPYEFVITLAVADLATTPMQDISTPILYGLVPLVTIFVVHYFVTLISVKSIRFRKALNGKPMIIIDSDGINSECCKKLNINTNDLLEMIRQQGYFSVAEISYAVIETNGKLSIMANEEAEAPQSIPMTVIVEGRLMGENLQSINITKDKINEVISAQKLKLKDVTLMTLDSNTAFIQPRYGKYFTVEVQ